jgi:ABC-type multidrug transport system ATPase subunit
MSKIAQEKGRSDAALEHVDKDEMLLDGIAPLVSPIQMIDRSSPAWARVMSWFFSIGTALCLLSICVLTVFFFDQVAFAKEPLMASLLAGVGLIPVVGLLIFEFSHAKALAGYRMFRERNVVLSQAAMGGVAFLLLETVHPLLGSAIPVGVVLNFLAISAFKRMHKNEPLWDFLPAESIPVLAGRDEVGRKLALSEQTEHALLAGFQRAVVWFSLVLGFGIASWLAATDVVSPAAVAAVGLITFWSVDVVSKYLVLRSMANPMELGLAASVTRLRMPPTSLQDAEIGGLFVAGLSVMTPHQNPILSEVSFHMAPGTVLGLIGHPGAGKTTLMKALVGPYDMSGLEVRGLVRLGENDLWERRTTPSAIPAFFMPSQPLMLPTSGQNNLSYFQQGSILEQGKRILEQMVFASDTVEKICATADASKLSGSEQKALGFARGFLLSPQLYLIDRPEDGVSEKLMGALVARIRQECRAGRSFVVVTENRALLDICDKLLVLQEGRVIDFGPADEIRARQSSGWQRFVGSRNLEAEENLESWVRSHFKRDGDEVNRRNVCMVAAELLAFSCQNVAAFSQQSICFEFKHFEGHCVIKMIDRDIPVSSGVLQRAHTEAEETDGKSRLSPLAAVFKLCSKVEATVERDQRVLEAQLQTYDPRKSGGKPPKGVTMGGRNAGVGPDANKT